MPVHVARAHALHFVRLDLYMRGHSTRVFTHCCPWSWGVGSRYPDQIHHLLRSCFVTRGTRLLFLGFYFSSFTLPTLCSNRANLPLLRVYIPLLLYLLIIHDRSRTKAIHSGSINERPWTKAIHSGSINDRSRTKAIHSGSNKRPIKVHRAAQSLSESKD